MENIEIFIKPIIKKKWLSNLIARNRLATRSLVSTKIYFKVTPLNGTIQDKIKIQFLGIYPDQ